MNRDFKDWQRLIAVLTDQPQSPTELAQKSGLSVLRVNWGLRSLTEHYTGAATMTGVKGSFLWSKGSRAAEILKSLNESIAQSK